MPWMGKSRCTACHPKGLISLVVAGLLMFMGMQASATLPALKPQRAERAQPLEFTRKLLSQNETVSLDGDAPLQICNSASNPSDFYGIISRLALVIGVKAIQVGIARDMPAAPFACLAGITSPRGPPRVIS